MTAGVGEYPAVDGWEAIGDTPAYVYDLAEVRRAHGLLLGALPAPSSLLYSLKANPHPDLLSTLRRLGCEAEVSSPGELTAALGAGFEAGGVLYTGPAKRDADIAGALDAGVRRFSVDSPAGLAQLERLSAARRCRARCVLRVNGDRPVAVQGLTMTGVASPFGADVDWVEREPERFRAGPWVTLEGLHLYMGSNIVGEDDLLTQFIAALSVVERLRVVCGPFTTVDLGGGFGAPFARAGALPRFPTLARRLEPHLDRVLPGWRRGSCRILFESGRYLTAACGRLLVRVLEVKRSHGTEVAILESGINHLGGMSGLRRLRPVAPTLVTAEPRSADATTVVLAGPLCTPLDTWSRSATLPRLRAGDLVAVPNVGAYGLTASLLAFLGHPAPVEVVVDGERVVSRSRLSIHRHPTLEE